jgi:hypothetical protein
MARSCRLDRLHHASAGRGDEGAMPRAYERFGHLQAAELGAAGAHARDDLQDREALRHAGLPGGLLRRRVVERRLGPSL